MLICSQLKKPGTAQNLALNSFSYYNIEREDRVKLQRMQKYNYSFQPEVFVRATTIITMRHKS